MARQGNDSTRADGTYRRLRADILGAQLTPGSRLKFPELCERYETSVGAAREALARLAVEGLVTSQPHRGYFVVELSPGDLAELTQARMEIESLVLRLSVQHGDRKWEARAVAAHHLLEHTPPLEPTDPVRPSEEWVEAHAAFHLTLLAGCPNRRLLDMARSLREEAELYRQWSVSLGHEPDRDVAAEHKRILEAVIGRDPDLASARIRDHLAHTAHLVIPAS